MSLSVEPMSVPEAAPYPVHLVAVPIAVVFGLLLFNCLNSAGYINYDCAFYLLGSKLLLDGKQPIQHFVDLLPPIILYFSVPPWWFSKLLSVPIIEVWQFCVLSLIYLSGFASVAVLRQAKGVEHRDLHSIGPLITAFFLLQLILGFHFGQREHLFILAYFPMFLLRWLRWQDCFSASLKLVPAALGIACGAVVYVKLQFLIIPILVELALFVSLHHRRQWRACLFSVETKAFLTTLLTCVLASFAIPNIHEYYTRWVPFLIQGYPAYNAPSLWSVLSFTNPDGYMLSSVAAGIVVILCGLVFCRCSSLLSALLAWSFGGLIIFVLQGRGWSYQSIPFITGFFLVASTALHTIVDALLKTFSSKLNVIRVLVSNPQQFAVISFLLWSASLIPLCPLLVKNSMVTGKTFNSLENLIVAETSPSDPVVILHTMLPHAHQLQLKKELTPVTRYVWCFPLRMTYYLKSKPDTREAAMAQEAKVVSEIVNDIQNGKPNLVIIEAWATQPDGWSLARELENYRFSQTALADYDPKGLVNGCSVWKRRNSL